MVYLPQEEICPISEQLLFSLYAPHPDNRPNGKSR
jgi:hypothetical protein